MFLCGFFCLFGGIPQPPDGPHLFFVLNGPCHLALRLQVPHLCLELLRLFFVVVVVVFLGKVLSGLRHFHHLYILFPTTFLEKVNGEKGEFDLFQFACLYGDKGGTRLERGDSSFRIHLDLLPNFPLCFFPLVDFGPNDQIIYHYFLLGMCALSCFFPLFFWECSSPQVLAVPSPPKNIVFTGGTKSFQWW